MAEKDALIPPPTDVSRPALAIARLIDRTCRYPGRYVIEVIVPDHRRRPWVIQLHQTESIGLFEVKRS